VSRHPVRYRAVIAAAVCCAAAAALAARPAQTHDREDPELRRTETIRLRAHFDSVLAELAGRDVSELAPSQRAARATLVRRLADYRDRGVFPHNHDHPGKRVPYFRDEHGTLCAMAYLVASTGRVDIVDGVAAARNNAYIPQLADDQRLVAWLDSVGLTANEAARIQPFYEGPGGGLVAEARSNTERNAWLSAAFGVPALVTSVLNWRAPREKKTDAALIYGTLSGAAATVLGVSILSEERNKSARALGIADLVVGSAALVSVVRRGLRHTPDKQAQPPVAGSESRMRVDVGPSLQHGRFVSAGRVRITF
jgi:hypothetical protein